MRKIIPSGLTAMLALAVPACADEPLVALSAVNVTDMPANVQGGIARQGRVLNKLDVAAPYMGDDHGHPGLQFFRDVQATDATDFGGQVVGDAQVVSNSDAPAGGRVLNAWVAQEWDGFGGVKAGILALNREFDMHQTGALFLNSAHGIGSDSAQALSGQSGQLRDQVQQFPAGVKAA